MKISVSAFDLILILEFYEFFVKKSSNVSCVHIINNRWIYKIKLNQNDSINKHKTAFVAKKFQQKYDIDFLKIYSNTIKSMMYRMLFAFVAYNNCELKQWNIKFAFFNAKLKSHLRIYVKQSKKYEKNKNKNLICLLRTILYDLK